MADWQLRTTDGRVVVPALEIAATWWTRFAGLQFRRPLPTNQALLIVPCPSIHTCFVRSPLDVWFLDRSGRVVDFRASLPPWKIAIPKVSAYGTLEATPGWLQLSLGEQVQVSPYPGGKAPPLLSQFYQTESGHPE